MGGLDRRKHDVDVIERVLGGLRDSDADDGRTRVFDVEVPWVSGSRDQTLEITVRIDDAATTAIIRPKARGPRAKGLPVPAVLR